MEQLLRKLGINSNQNAEVILEELGKVQMEYLERLDSVEEEKRKNQLEADLKEIESAISSLSWMANRTATGMKRDKDNKDDFSDLKNQQEEESKTEIESGGDVEERLYDQALALMATPDYAKGVEMMRKLAEDGYHWAQRQMGKMYAEGNRVQKDEAEAVKWYRKAAEQGNAEAQACLGSRYLYGTGGIAQDNAMALKWLQMAADQGVSYAQADLAFMYYNGQGVEQNEKKAAELFLKAAEQGNAYAQSHMGMFYQNGYGVELDNRKAAEWYEKAAEQGEPFSQLHLAWMYQYGEGVKKNADTAVKWYEAAAENGESQAYVNLGLMYENGDGVEQDYKMAVQWYAKAADNGDEKAKGRLGQLVDTKKVSIYDVKNAMADNGNIEAKYWISEEFYNDKEYFLAIPCYIELAELGQKKAVNKLISILNLRNDDVELLRDDILTAINKAAEMDCDIAVKYVKQENISIEKEENSSITEKKYFELKLEEARQGNIDAQFEVGSMYYRGDDVQQDYLLAAEWYQKAADQGDDNAQRLLARMYRDGVGVNKDNAKAEKLFKQAFDTYKGLVDNGDDNGSLGLGFIYEFGDGVEKNDGIAIEWYEKALQQGNFQAKVRLDKMKEEGRYIKKESTLSQKLKGIFGRK